MDALLDRFYEDIEYAVKIQYRDYYIKVSQLNSSFLFLLNVVEVKFWEKKENFYLIG